MLNRTFASSLIALILLSGCVTTASHPCLDGGQPARDKPWAGHKQCTQQRDPSGKYMNHGVYREWHSNGQIALDGEYKEGKKTGKWTEWDENGKRTSLKYYDEGVEVPDRTSFAK